MTPQLLNHNQRRHVATYLQLLLEDLGELEQSPGPARDHPGHHLVLSALRETAAAVRRIGEALNVPVERPRDFRRRVGAVANVWATRTYEIETRALAAYGRVDPELGHILAPLVAELRHRLHALAEAAERPREA